LLCAITTIALVSVLVFWRHVTPAHEAILPQEQVLLPDGPLSSCPRDAQEAEVTLRTSSAKPGIALVISSTTRGLSLIDGFGGAAGGGDYALLQLPLFRYVLPSLLQTMETDGFHYGVFVGVDAGDDVLDSCANVRAMRRLWREMLAEHQASVAAMRAAGQDFTMVIDANGAQFRARLPPPDPEPVVIPLHVYAYANTRHHNVWAVNYISLAAYEQGYTYFLRINDDTQLVSSRWSTAFLRTIKAHYPSDYGSVAPFDPNYVGPPDAQVHTHSFVSRRHFEIFGFYFPFQTPNLWSDDWIGSVYNNWTSLRMNTMLRSVSVKHVVIPPRYKIQGTKERYLEQLAIDRQVLRDHLIENKYI
jgi:hypothetical protein